MVTVESKSNKRQVVPGISLWHWECFFWCIILWDVVKVFCVGVAVQLRNDWWNGYTQQHITSSWLQTRHCNVTPLFVIHSSAAIGCLLWWCHLVNAYGVKAWCD